MSVCVCVFVYVWLYARTHIRENWCYILHLPYFKNHIRHQCMGQFPYIWPFVLKQQLQRQFLTIPPQMLQCISQTTDTLFRLHYICLDTAVLRSNTITLLPIVETFILAAVLQSIPWPPKSLLPVLYITNRLQSSFYLFYTIIGSFNDSWSCTSFFWTSFFYCIWFTSTVTKNFINTYIKRLIMEWHVTSLTLICRVLPKCWEEFDSTGLVKT